MNAILNRYNKATFSRYLKYNSQISGKKLKCKYEYKYKYKYFVCMSEIFFFLLRCSCSCSCSSSKGMKDICARTGKNGIKDEPFIYEWEVCTRS